LSDWTLRRIKYRPGADIRSPGYLNSEIIHRFNSTHSAKAVERNPIATGSLESAMSKSWRGKFLLILNIKSEISSAQAICSLKSPTITNREVQNPIKHFCSATTAQHRLKRFSVVEIVNPSNAIPIF
jgi:hypothetical protein